MKVLITSFGFKFAEPPEAQFVFDVRRLRNPFHVKTLANKDGTHAHVKGYVLANQLGQDTVTAIVQALRALLPGTKDKGPGTAAGAVTVAIGCTGGFHRSVAVAEEIAVKLKRGGLVDTEVVHRDSRRKFGA